MKWEGRGLAAVSLLGTSTIHFLSLGERKKKRTRSERQVEWKSFNQLLILLALSTLDAMQYTSGTAAHLSQQHRAQHEWVRWEVLERFNVIFNFVALSCTHILQWMEVLTRKGGGEILHSTPHVITNVSFTKRGKRESIRYVGGGRRFQNTFQIARLTNSLFPPARRRCEERRINTQPGRASCFFYYTALHREASPFFFRLAILHERKSLLLKLSVERVMS